MYFTNNDLFSNAYLNTISISSPQKEEAMALLRSIKDWYRQADFSESEALLRTFILPVLQNQSLGCLPISQNRHAYFLTPPWDKDEILGLLYLVPTVEQLSILKEADRIQKGKDWMIRAVNLALEQNIKWIILTNGHTWRLVNSQILHRYESFFEINITEVIHSGVNDREFSLAIFLFNRVFGFEHGFSKDEATNKQHLEDFYDASQSYSVKIEQYLKQTVTDDLGTSGGGDGILAQLCYGFVRSMDPEGTRRFTEEERNAIFRDATYLLYRLLFLFYAEARGLLPVHHLSYKNASLMRLVDQAKDVLGATANLSHTGFELWKNLSHLFTLVDIGDVPLQIPAFDGGLFDNYGHQYLQENQIPNYHLAQALVQLAFFHDKKGNIEEKIDYRDLSVRHLGSLYEGMIEYRLYIADEELIARRKNDGGVQYIAAASNKKKINDELLHQGSIYFAQTSRERKATGTHYTPENLVAKLVNQTVLKELQHRWGQFKNEYSIFLQEYSEIVDASKKDAFQHYIDHQLERFVETQALSLRVCDPAMGSGHFLVYTTHAITNFILWVLSQTPWENPDIDLNPLSWRRRVVESCIYGVDINPMAVELAKLSLWLATMQADYPLSFLDHRLKSGNSLLGVSFGEIANVLEESELNRATERSSVREAQGQYAFRESSYLEKAAEEAVGAIQHLLSLSGNDLESVKAQKQDYRTALELLQAYKHVGDFLVAIKMGLKADHTIRYKTAKSLEQGILPDDTRTNGILAETRQLLSDHMPFHWALEFPDIFLAEENIGFDVVIGNPPYLGGYKIKGDLGKHFAQFLRQHYVTAKGQVDLSAYFLLNCAKLIKETGSIGLVVTNTISQGDTRRAALAYLVEESYFIFFAEKYIRWSGDAIVEVNLICLGKSRNFESESLLDNITVDFISSWLDDLPEEEPQKLMCNMDKAFIGDAPRGIGFILSPEEAQNLLRNPKNHDCVHPYLTGQDLNNSPDQQATRFIICFEDWPKEKAATYIEPFRIVEERVKPQRMKVAEMNEREHWWQFARFRKELRKSIANKEYSVARSSISEYHTLSFIPNYQINSKQLVVFTYDDWFSFTILQSYVHEVWLRRQASSLETRTSYTPTDCFQTFPFPQKIDAEIQKQADQNGKRLYEERQQVMLSRQLGLTKTYNLLHDPACSDEDIVNLRELQIKMDQSVLACYGWDDIVLDYNYYQNDRKKIRYMPSAAAQREIFSRLLALNHRIAEEEAQSAI